MRQKKSKTFLPLLGILFVIAVIFIAAKEVSAPTEHVEQPLENTFLKNK